MSVNTFHIELSEPKLAQILFKATSRSSLNMSPIGPFLGVPPIQSGVQKFTKFSIKPTILEMSEPNLAQMLFRTTSRSSLNMSLIGPFLEAPPIQMGIQNFAKLG